MDAHSCTELNLEILGLVCVSKDVLVFICFVFFNIWYHILSYNAHAYSKVKNLGILLLKTRNKTIVNTNF